MKNLVAAEARLVSTNFHLEICAFLFGYVDGVLNVHGEMNLLRLISA